jgi:hypothetical protein
MVAAVTCDDTRGGTALADAGCDDSVIHLAEGDGNEDDDGGGESDDDSGGGDK